MGGRRPLRAVAALAILAAIAPATAPALPLPLASIDPFPALAGDAPVATALDIARAARGLDAIPVPPPGPAAFLLGPALLRLRDALDAPGSPEERAALVADAARLPGEVAAPTALLVNAIADALDLATRGPAGEIAGAVAVARAIDVAAPAIADAAATLPPVRFYDPQIPLFVDTGTTDDVHVVPMVLAIDAGGDDRWLGAHGAGYRSKMVGVAIDLAGDDVYATPGVGSPVAQGGSRSGVLGVLYDAAGDDVYEAHELDRPGEPEYSAYQGGCTGTGVGLLVDVEGDDRYEAMLPEAGGAQGTGSLCVGVAIDLDGDDRYRAGSATGDASQGTGYLGVGILLNRGGNDTYDSSTTYRQGAAWVGLGILADYGGTDAYNGDATVNDRLRPAGGDVRQYVGVLVDSRPPVSTGRARLPYKVETRDADGDQIPAIYFRVHDVTVDWDSSPPVAYGNEGPYSPLERPYVGDPDDFEGFEHVRLDGPARCVIAVVDSGINPYHVEFRASGLPRSPSAWIPGFPADARPLDLALDAATYDDAVAADDATWRAVEAERLYTIPGTRVVGVISFGAIGDPWIGDVRVLDEKGHGTSTAGAAAGRTTGLGPACAIVAVEAEDRRRAIEWVAGQPWIDAVSISIGTRGGLYLPSGVANATHLAAKTGKAVIVGSGNGLLDSDTPTPTIAPLGPYPGPPWVVAVGPVSGWNDQPAWWGSYPVDVVSLGSKSRTPGHRTLDGFVDFMGTSLSAPRVAGVVGEVLRAARATVATRLPAQGPLADGELSRGEWIRTVFATARPEGVSSSLLYWCLERDVPSCIATERWWFYLLPAVDRVEFLTEGYGVVDAATRDVAVDVMRGARGMPARPNEDAWARTVHAFREAFWGAHDNPVVSLYQEV